MKIAFPTLGTKLKSDKYLNFFGFLAHLVKHGNEKTSKRREALRDRQQNLLRRVFEILRP